METWLPIIVVIITFILAMSKGLLRLKKLLPPGPKSIPIISSIQFLLKSTLQIEASLQKLHPKYGPIVTLSVVSRPFIFISSPSLAHEALIQKGIIFANRPDSLLTSKILTNNQLNISSANYGHMWRVFRRNLISITHPSHAKHFSHARKWVLNLLLERLKTDGSSPTLEVAEHFKFAMFALLVFMCFGDKLLDSQIGDIQFIQHRLLSSFSRFQILNFYPPVTKIVLKSRWNELFDLKRKREEVLFPYVEARQHFHRQKMLSSNCYDESIRMVTSYVDTLFELEISDNDNQDKRKLNEEELVTLCSEFLNAGTDTTSTALQWIMANLVKYPIIQNTLFEAIKKVVRNYVEEVEEDELSKISYLKVVVLEGLRRHPPSYFSLPHAVREETELGGYNIPPNAIIFFTLAEMCRDPKVWEDPMEFKPERFMLMPHDQEIDLTGNREIKMMPFGVGRRICPAMKLAMLHLEYYVANLVWKFEWKLADGSDDVGTTGVAKNFSDVDLSEKQEFTIVMKYPLRAKLIPRVFK